MVKLWQVSNIALRNSYRRCSIKKALLKNLAILIRKHLCSSLFLVNLQAYKPTTLLQRDSNKGIFLWILPNFKNIYVKGYLWTTASELYWFKVKDIKIEKKETYSEMIMRDVKHSYSYSSQQIRTQSQEFTNLDLFLR